MSAARVVLVGLSLGLSLVAAAAVSVFRSPWLFTVGARVHGWWTA